MPISPIHWPPGIPTPPRGVRIAAGATGSEPPVYSTGKYKTGVTGAFRIVPHKFDKTGWGDGHTEALIYKIFDTLYLFLHA